MFVWAIYFSLMDVRWPEPSLIRVLNVSPAVASFPSGQTFRLVKQYIFSSFLTENPGKSNLHGRRTIRCAAGRWLLGVGFTMKQLAESRSRISKHPKIWLCPKHGAHARAHIYTPTLQFDTKRNCGHSVYYIYIHFVFSSCVCIK